VKKVRVIQDEFDHVIAQATAPEKLLPLALARSAEQQNLKLEESDIKALAAALLGAQDGVVQLGLGFPCAFGNDEDEVKATIQKLVDSLDEAITEIGDKLSGSMTDIVHDSLTKIADLIGGEVLAQSFEHTRCLEVEQLRRVEAVQRLWGTAIEQLDILRNLVVEWDCTAMGLKVGGYANPNTAFALNRLVLRAYDIVGEIIALVRAGYADGALARWRSLHEVCIIAMFLSKRSDKCSWMYLSHHWIEELRLNEANQASGAMIITNSDNDRYIRELRKKKRELIGKFGAAFAKDYGWAAVELGCAKATFRDLEGHVGMDTLRRGYQQANSTIHGGSLATLTRVSLGGRARDTAGIPPAYGCEVATNYTSASLSMMIAELCLETENADLLTMNMIVQKFSRSIRDQIYQAQRKVSRETPRARFVARELARNTLKTKSRRGLKH